MCCTVRMLDKDRSNKTQVCVKAHSVSSGQSLPLSLSYFTDFCEDKRLAGGRMMDMHMQPHRKDGIKYSQM